MQVSSQPFTSLLSKIVDNRGRTCPTAPVGRPLIATNCVRNDLLYPTYENARFVDETTYQTWFRGHPQPGDLLFVTKGTPGRVCLVPDPVDFCIAQDMVAIRANPLKIYPLFLLALLRSDLVQRQIEQLHVGSLIPHFKKGDFDKLLLPVPERAAQTFIGDLYFEFSAKIELNRQMNETLEAIAQALFKSWFVDFDPVRAKAEGHDTGLPTHLADLFPDAFEESELGEIPRGWRVKSVGSLATVVGGSTPSTKEPAFWEGGQHCWVTPKDLASLTTPVLLDTDRKVTGLGLAQIASGLLPSGTILLSSRAPIGYLAISEVPTAINQGFIALKPSTEIPNIFLLYWAEWAHGQIVSRANGSTFLEISKSNFKPIPVVVSPVHILEAFDRIVRPIYQRIVANEKESRINACLRDTLLPKLISGELRIRNAERIIGGQI